MEWLYTFWRRCVDISIEVFTKNPLMQDGYILFIPFLRCSPFDTATLHQTLVRFSIVAPLVAAQQDIQEIRSAI